MPDKSIAIEIEADTICIFGVRYSLELFRGLGLAPIGSLFRLVIRDDCITLEIIPEGATHADR